MLLEVDNLSIGFRKKKETIVLVEALSFSLDEGRVLGLVGESGSGKTITADALVGLLRPPLSQRSGRIVFAGKGLECRHPQGWEEVRGRGIFYIFQNPLAALNPTLTVGKQVQETLKRHFNLDESTAVKQTKILLEEVGLGAAAAGHFPFALSGGMRQRVLWAMALGLEPKFLVADEPFTGLDPIRQLEILALLKRLQRKGTAVLVISHDLSLVSGWADQVAVMVAGRLVEQLPGKEILTQGRHPYTQSLVKNLLLLEETLGPSA